MLAILVSTSFAQAADGDKIDNWRDTSTGITWMNGTNELCWRDAFWNPETASTEKCGKPAAPAPVVAAPAPAPVVEVAPMTAPVAPQITTEKVTFAADALFDFNKASLKPEGKMKLDELVANLKNPDMKLEVVVAIGHTDSFGKDAYNDKLSLARAQTVRGYLVANGLESSKVFAEGKGKRQLKVDPKTCPKKRDARIACEAPSRRVEVEVSGSKTTTRMVQPMAIQSPAIAPLPTATPAR